MEQSTLRQLIEIVKTADSTEVKTAQKEIEKHYNNGGYPLSESRRKEFGIFVEEVKEFDQIKNLNNQMYFINTLKWPFLATGEENFQIFADFIIQQIQNPAGKIRQAIINAVDWLVIAAAFDLESVFGRPTKKEREEINQNKKRFYFLTSQIMKLLDEYDEPRFNKYKFVASMPPSIYKSIQILIVEHLLPTGHQEIVYEECKKGSLSRSSVLELGFAARRLKIEKELTKLLQEYQSSFSVENIKEIIYNEEGQNDLMRIVRLFDYGGDAVELQNILDLATDAWNYFPHQALGGRSPMEITDNK